VARVDDTFLIYIVDDDDSVRCGLARLMRASGYQTKAYSSPEQFLEEVSSESVGCILLDITMHGMTGPQVQTRLREKGIHLPVIAVSAHENDEIRKTARELGAQFYLRKPVDDQALLDAISWVVGSTHKV
jgi:FixJ family two-component response regulator